MSIPPDAVIIDDDTSVDVTHDGRFSKGYDPSQVVKEMFGAPTEIPIIPRSEWDARIDEQEREQSSISHVRNRAVNGGVMPCLDQNGRGYCWAHSITHTVMLQRALANLPYVPLSAYAVACIIKNYADEGGWCGLSAKFARERGIPSQKFWPQPVPGSGSSSGAVSRSYDNPETWANAAQHKVTEDFVDLTRAVYDQNLTFDQVATCLLLNLPVAVDFNWWGHSIAAMRLVRVEAGSYGLEILNSWYEGPGRMWNGTGTAILRGSKAIPDGAVCTRRSTVSK